MTREELIEVMARAILRDHGDGANMDTHAVPERAASRHAIAALAALEAAGVRLVPVGATHQMAHAGTEARWQSAVRDANNVREIWGAMLAASPYAK